MNNKNVSSQLALHIKHKSTRVNRALTTNARRKWTTMPLKKLHGSSVKKGNFVHESH
jgi:hypothetical protein